MRNELRPSPDGSANVVFMLADLLRANFANVAPAFDAWVQQSPTRKYVIISDYCREHDGFPNDAYVFTLMRGGDEFLKPEEIAVHVPCDYKNARESDLEPAIAFLRSERFFTIAVATDPGMRLLSTTDRMRASLEGTLHMVSTWGNAEAHGDFIKRLRAMAQDGQKRSGGALRLFQTMLFVSVVVAWISTELLRRTPVDVLGWCSDRDNITTKADELVKWLWDAALNDLCAYYDVPRAQNRGFLREPGGTAAGPTWYDPYIRLADFIAGPLAALDFNHPRDKSYSFGIDKRDRILSGLLRENPRLAIILLRGATWPLSASLVTVSSQPPNIPPTAEQVP